MRLRPDPESHAPVPAPLVYQLHVSLHDVDPPIWRRLLVPADIPLRRLHRVLRTAMGWKGDEQWAFETDHLRYGEPDADLPGDMLDARGMRLDQLLPDVGAELTYEYDFGDAWLHRIRLERIAPDDPSRQLPLCIDGARACPPVGCGGVYAYEELLHAASDPHDPEHRRLLDEHGGALEPERFDLRAVNAALAGLT
jgi:hypothetical protein